jgi:hypothetical protein
LLIGHRRQQGSCRVNLAQRIKAAIECKLHPIAAYQR